MMWIMATSMYASLEASRISSSFEKRRYLPSQANVRSTIQRFGKTTKPLEVRRMISSDQREARGPHPSFQASSVSRVGTNDPQAGEVERRSGQDPLRPVTILHARRMDHTTEHQSQRVNEQVLLSSVDLFGTHLVSL